MEVERKKLLPITTRLAALAFLAVTVLIGCSTIPEKSLIIPKMEGPDSSAIGISVERLASISWLDIYAQSVYFVRIDNKDDLFQKRIFKSNYATDERVYLLNVPPGVYVAVASFDAESLGQMKVSKHVEKPKPVKPKYGFKDKDMRQLVDPSTFSTSSNASKTKRSEPTMSKSFVYFSEELIERTRVTVKAGQFVFLGDYTVKGITHPSNARPIQHHYRDVVEAYALEHGLGDFKMSTIKYYESQYEFDHSRDGEVEFLKGAKKDLTGSGWADLIE